MRRNSGWGNPQFGRIPPKRLARLPPGVTVLIVEDEDMLRSALSMMLRQAGVEVFEAADGSSAIEILRANGGKIDVMLLDMTLPGASSREIVAEASKARPDIKSDVYQRL